MSSDTPGIVERLQRLRASGIDSTGIGRWVFYLATVGLILVLVGAPLVFFVWGSFWTTEPGLGGEFTLQGYRTVFTNPSLHSTVADTFIIAVLGTIIAVTLGIATAILSVKTTLRGRSAIQFVVISQYLMPGFVLALGWDFYSDPAGPINLALSALPFLGQAPFNINTVYGIALVAGVHYAGLVFLLISGSVGSIPSSLEEAGQLSGASDWTLIRKVILPLSVPAIAISTVLIFVRLIQFFDIPVVLGLQARIFVLSTQIFLSVTQFPPDFALAAAIGVLILVISVVGLVLQLRVTGPREQYETIGGREATGHIYRYSLGRLKWPVIVTVGAALILFYILPIFTIALSSFQTTFVGFNFQLAEWTTFNYTNILWGTRSDQFWQALVNSLIISGLGAGIGMFVASFASYIIIKSESPVGEFLNILTLSPTAIPGIVIAVSLFWIFVTYKLTGLFGTVWIIIIAFTAKFIVYGTRATNSAFRSLSDELEEAAQVSGANLFTIFKDVFIPLIKPGFVAGYLLLFIDYLKVLSIPLVLRGGDNTNLAVYIWDVNAAGYPSVAAAISTILIAIIFLLYTGIKYFTSYDLAEI